VRPLPQRVRREAAAIASRTTRTTSSTTAPGVSTPATPRSSSRGHVTIGDDPADDHRDVDTACAALVDDERDERHVRAAEHRQPDRVDVLVDRAAATVWGVWNSPCRSPRSRRRAGSWRPP
jgi:hypothetical protein